MSDDLAFLPATDLLDKFKTRQLSPVEALKAALAQVASYDGPLNVFCLIDEEAAFRQARESEARWQRGAPLGLVDGVPTTIKDMFLTKGWPTLRGSKTIDKAGPWKRICRLSRGYANRAPSLSARPSNPNSAGRPSPTVPCME